MDDKTPEKVINDLAIALSNTFMTVYIDGLQPAVREFGKLFATPFEISNKIIRKWLSDSEDTIEMNNNEIKAKYKKFVSSGKNIHPSFFNKIQQLSDEDLTLIKNGHYLEKPSPLIRIFLCEEITGKDEEMHKAGMTEFVTSNYKIPVFSHYSLHIDTVPEALARSISINNLYSLGLINVDYIEKIIKPKGYELLYKEAKNSEYYTKADEETRQNEGVFLGLTRGYTSPTELGKLFFRTFSSEL